MSDSKVIYLTESTVTEGADAEEWTQALPEVRWVSRPNNASMLLQQRWRILVDGKPPRHEWRDVPTVKEE